MISYNQRESSRLIPTERITKTQDVSELVVLLFDILST